MKALAGRKPWQPQTFHRELAALHGAFSNLGIYCHEFGFGIDLNGSVIWRNAMDAWDRKAVQANPEDLPAATVDDIEKVISLTKDKELRVFVMFLWLSCGRRGDVAQLQQGSVTLHDNRRLEFFIQEGKGVHARRQKYRVISQCPQKWFNEIKRFLSVARAHGSRLFRDEMGKGTLVPHLIKKANPVLDGCRATRRGAAQAMARDPTVSRETLMRMTGHRSLDTLYRYLNWDKVNEKAHREQQAAAANLDPNGRRQ